MVTAWQDILKAGKNIAVVGLSKNPWRASHGVASCLQFVGFRIVPVNPVLQGPFLGEDPHPSWSDLAEAGEVIDVFRNEGELPGRVQEILALLWKPRLVWFQLGLLPKPEDRSALEIAGIQVVENRCLQVDHTRFLA